jgi:hypothetical protein
MTPAISATAQHRRTYDLHLREQVFRTGARSLAHKLHVPRSTITSWKRRGPRTVVALEVFGYDRQQLLTISEKLEKRARILQSTGARPADVAGKS